MNGDSDIGVELLFQQERNAVVDLSRCYHFNFNLVSTKLKPLSPIWNLVKPFPYEVWILVAIFVVCMTLFWSGFNRMTGEKIPYIAVFQSHMNQSIRMKSKSNPTKVLFLFWIIYIFLIDAFYECNLRAYLVSSDYEEPVNTVEDIVRLDRKLFLPEGGAFAPSFAATKIESYQKVNEIMEREGNFFKFVRGFPTKEFEQVF